MSTSKLFFFILSFCLILTACQKDPVKPVPTPINKVPIVEVIANKSVQINTSPGLDTVQISGSASDSDGTIKSYLWSQVSGPNSSAIQNPGSPSTIVGGLIAGAYVFQLNATDNQGATGTNSVTITVTVKAPQNFNVALSPSNNPNESLIAGNNVDDFTSPNFTEIDASTWTINQETLSGRGVFKFDLSTIPPGATITSAKLSLFSNPTPSNGNLVDANFGTSNAMYIRRITSNWDVNTDWFSQPSTESANQISVPQTSQSRLDLIDVDVTAMVSKMYTVTNYGFMLQLQTEIIYNSRIFCSSYYADATKHPKLVINYSK